MKTGKKKALEAIPVQLLTQRVNPVKGDTNKTPVDPEFAEFREIHSHISFIKFNVLEILPK
jgi:hypothetical protein